MIQHKIKKNKIGIYIQISVSLSDTACMLHGRKLYFIRYSTTNECILLDQKRFNVLFLNRNVV